MIIKNLAEKIGDTPLMEIKQSTHGLKNVNIYAKLELLNPYGSLKDRVALNMLDLKKAKNKIVIESSSGNTAKALVGLCNSYGLEFKTVTNRIKQPEIREILQIFGADIEELPGFSECPDPNDPNDPIEVIEREVRENPQKYFHTSQYFNPKNISAHKVSGQEIVKDLDKVDYFYGFLGTCGSTCGIGIVLREKLNSKIIGVVTKEAEYVPGGRTENELYETGFFKADFYDEIIKGTINEAIDGMMTLVRKEGIPCGPTSGLIYSSLIKHLSKLEIKKPINVVFIVCDRIESYISYLQKYRKEIFLGKQEKKSDKVLEDIFNVSYEEVIEANEIDSEKIDDNALLIDIRSNYSFNFNSIAGSINIPANLLEELIKQKNAFPKDRQIILICPKGTISKRYTAILEKQGLDVYSLKNGILNYK